MMEIEYIGSTEQSRKFWFTVSTLRVYGVCKMDDNQWCCFNNEGDFRVFSTRGEAIKAFKEAEGLYDAPTD